MLTQNKFSNLMRCEAKMAKVEIINWIFTQNKFSNLMRCEAKLAKREAIGWNAYAEQVQQLDALWGKNGKKRGYWLKCLRGTSSATWCVVRQKWQKERLLIEMLTQNKFSNLMRCEAKLTKVEVINWIFTQNKFSNLMRCEAKLAKREAIGWNAYAEQVQQLDALWGKIGKKTGYWLKCLRRTSSATWCVVRQNWQK